MSGVKRNGDSSTNQAGTQESAPSSSGTTPSGSKKATVKDKVRLASPSLRENQSQSQPKLTADEVHKRTPRPSSS